MVFTPIKNAPLNVFDYKVERLINSMKWTDVEASDLEMLRLEYNNIRCKLKSNFTMTNEEIRLLDLLNKVM